MTETAPSSLLLIGCPVLLKNLFLQSKAMERQERHNMEISGSSIRHHIEVPKVQSPSETNINPTSPARTLQQSQTETDNATARQKGRVSNIILQIDIVFLIIQDISDVNKNK